MHHNTRCIRPPSPPQFKRVVFTTMSFCGAAYALCGFCGYVQLYILQIVNH